MEPGADSRTGRQTQDRGGVQVEERLGTDPGSHERLLSAHEGFAPAKVNLFLHVGPAGSDGYHPICSLISFADVGDFVRLVESDGPDLIIDGPFANGLSSSADNLVVRARDVALALADGSNPRIRFHLTKNLPLASGIGGGSADAAAAFRLLASRLGLESSALVEAAAGLGSDVPACVSSRPVMATGRGDVMQPPPGLPPLHAVLVNPGVGSPTATVYRAFDHAPANEGANLPWPKAALRTTRDAVTFLAGCRNDLEAPAARLLPPIAQVLAFLNHQPETLLARMSGSGATCFALVEDNETAIRLEARIAAREPGWWVRRTLLAGAS